MISTWAKGRGHTRTITRHNTDRLDVKGMVKKILITSFAKGSAGKLGGG